MRVFHKAAADPLGAVECHLSELLVTRCFLADSLFHRRAMALKVDNSRSGVKGSSIDRPP